MAFYIEVHEFLHTVIPAVAEYCDINPQAAILNKPLKGGACRNKTAFQGI